MTLALSHRGPDGEGFHVDESLGVYLGHRRLAVIDVQGGQQPLWNEDGTICVIFNGEIYNHRELRRELEARGHVFRTSHSDTEVLVHGYEEWHEQLPSLLNGMFAFVIFDRARRRLFIARDRFGEKPLYYVARPGLFAFASELSAFFQHPYLELSLDRMALQKYFAYGYIPAPLTLYQTCKKLPGGCYLTVGVDDSEHRVHRYWQFLLEPDDSMIGRGEDDLVEELRSLLAQATKRRLMSDVPLGVFLSGGLDSSTIAAAAVSGLPERSVNTFTIGFNEASFDESAFARLVAAVLPTRHHEETLSMQDAENIIPQVLRRCDEPLADASIIPTFLLSRFTRQHVTVALSGDGGDELFAGYDPFVALAPASFYSRFVSRGMHRSIRRLADLIPTSERNMAFDFKVRRTLMGLSYPRSIWNPVWLGPIEPNHMPDLFNAPLSADELFSEAIELWNRRPESCMVTRTLEFFTNFYLQDDILMKVDRASMMASLESRAVFLDNDLVAFCRRLPNRFKFHRGIRKYLLKRAVVGLIPREIVHRQKKGFGVPIAAWLRSIPLVPPMAPVPGAEMEYVERCWHEHRSKSGDHRMFLWSWLALQGVLEASPKTTFFPGSP